MDLTRLRTLQELAERETMAAVAEALHLSASAVSQQIAQLENETGLALVERRGRGVRLTAAGERLCHHTGRIVSILEEARTDLAELKNQVGGEVRLTTFPSFGAAIVPHAIRALRAAHPALHVTVLELEPDEGLAALRAWQADAAVIDDMTVSAEVAAGAFETEPLFHDRLFAVMGRDHRLSRQRAIALADFRDEAWAVDSSRKTYTQRLIQMCEAAGFSPRINAQCGSFELMAAMVEIGGSVSIMPGIRLRLIKGRAIARPLRPEVSRAISIAYRRGERRNPALQAVLQELRAQTARLTASD